MAVVIVIMKSVLDIMEEGQDKREAVVLHI
jgi:hypothetical protein